MLHLFHGDNIVKSRKELADINEKFHDKETVFYDGKNVTVSDLIQATQSNSLFALDRLIVIENLFTKKIGRKIKENQEYLEFIKNLQTDYEIIFWEEKELGKTLLNLFPKNTDIALFQLDKIIFKFLGSIKPNNTNLLLEQYNYCVKNDPPELIFSLLVRQIRYLLMVKHLGKNVTELSPWMIIKFIKQSEHFTFEKLLDIYSKLLNIELEIKTGKNAFNLTEALRLFLIEI